jgi:hypothetical protein
MDDDKKPEKDPNTGRFVTGNIGGGRRKGSRAKLGEAFIADMYEAWQRSGPDVIANVIATDPSAFLRSMVAILPKELDVNVNKYDSMTDEQLRSQFAAALREARSLGIDLGYGEPSGADQTSQSQPPGSVPPLH